MNIQVTVPDSVKKTRQFSRMETEKRILIAAEAAFAEQGYEGASTADIARRAGLPKANLHYYFKTKAELYHRVLEDIINLWRSVADKITEDADPALALADYIRHKINIARTHPLASRVYANELLHGAPILRDYIAGPLRVWLDEKAAIIQTWIDAGKLKPIDPRHLFFLLWTATQTYADFSIQMELCVGRPLGPEDYRKAANQLADTLINGLLPTKQ